jgi:hypothetical protein
MDLLFLTPGERTHLFSKLPVSVQDAWKDRLREETLESYEPPEELRQRAKESAFSDHPGVKAMFEKMAKHMEEGKPGNPFDAIALDDFPEDAMPSFLFMIGACGTEFFIESLLREPGLTDEDMTNIAALSRARHQMLQMNAVLA